MMARLLWYLDPLALYQLKKNVVKVRLPLKKLSGSAHEDIQLFVQFFMILFSSDLFNLTFSKKSFRNNIRVSNSDQVRHFVRPDLGPSCLQRSSADDKIHCLQAKN